MPVFRLRRRALQALAPAMLVVVAMSPASAEMGVSVARIAEGRLWVMGQGGLPGTAVTLDGRFTAAVGTSRLE